MERGPSKPMSYGRSCMRCRIYFVSSDPGVYVCPWCQKVEGGVMQDDTYDRPETVVVRSRAQGHVRE